MRRQAGTLQCVRSKNFTACLHEKSNFRKFLRPWFGRDLTSEELASFDTESLIGQTAHLVVVHVHKDSGTYAQIVACTPDQSTEVFSPSGKYVRVKDRSWKDKVHLRTDPMSNADAAHGCNKHGPLQRGGVQ